MPRAMATEKPNLVDSVLVATDLHSLNLHKHISQEHSWAHDRNLVCNLSLVMRFCLKSATPLLASCCSSRALVRKGLRSSEVIEEPDCVDSVLLEALQDPQDPGHSEEDQLPVSMSGMLQLSP